MYFIIVLAFMFLVASLLAVIGYSIESKKQKTMAKLAKYRALYYEGMPETELRYLNSKVSKLQGADK